MTANSSANVWYWCSSGITSVLESGQPAIICALSLWYVSASAAAARISFIVFCEATIRRSLNCSSSHVNAAISSAASLVLTFAVSATTAHCQEPTAGQSCSVVGEQLHTVLLALIVSRLRHALPAWSGFLKTNQTGQINAFLKRPYKYGLPKV